MFSQLKYQLSSWRSQALSTWKGRVAVTSVVVTGLVLITRQLGLLQGFELSAYDQLLRWKPERGEDERILVVGITEEDIKSTIKEFPVSDGTLAKALNKIQANKPRAIALDIIRDVPVGKGHSKLVKEFEQPNLIAVCQMNEAEDPGFAPPPKLPAEQVGFADLPQDADDVYRRSLLLALPPIPDRDYSSQHLCNDAESEELLYSLSLAASTLYLEEEGIEREITEYDDLQFGETIFPFLSPNAGGYHNIFADGLQILIDYRSAKNPTNFVSLNDILTDKVDPELIRDRLVFIGYEAKSSQDTFNTPYSAALETNPRMPGVVVHAQVASQILGAVLDNRPLIWYLPDPVEWLWILGWAVLGGLLALPKLKLWQVALADGVAIGVLVGTSYGLFLLAAWIPLIPPGLGLVMASVGVVLVDRVPAIKKLLKIDIDIDWERVKKDADQALGAESPKEEVAATVSEVTTEQDNYLTQLQTRAETRRKQTRKATTGRVVPVNQVSETATKDNFLAQLQDKAQTRRSKRQSPTTEISSPATEDNFLGALQQKAQARRNQERRPSATRVKPSVNPVSQTTAKDNFLSQLQTKALARRNKRQLSSPVAEIPTTESNFLTQLQAKAQTRRNKAKQTRPPLLTPVVNSGSKTRTGVKDNFLTQLQAKAQTRRNKGKRKTTAISLPPQGSYIEQLKQQSKQRLQEATTQASPPPVIATSQVSHSKVRNKYLEDLLARSKRLRSGD